MNTVVPTKNFRCGTIEDSPSLPLQSKLSLKLGGQRGQICLRVQCRAAATASSGDGLLVVGIDQVTSSKHARQASRSGWFSNLDVAVFLELNLAFENCDTRVVTCLLYTLTLPTILLV